MANNHETPTPAASPDSNPPVKTAAKPGRNALNGIVRYLNIIIPSIAVCLCAVVVFYLLQGEIKDSNSVHGTFVSSSSQGTGAYITFDRNGTYSFCENETASPQNGIWTMNGGKFTVTESTSGISKSMYFIDSKYIAFDDENFLEGDVPEKSLFDAQFTADDGTVYVFGSDGKCYTSEDGRNTELGGYITDGKFIVITIENKTHTYLNCGDGITPVYYTHA